MDMEDVMTRKMRVSRYPLTCYLDHKFFLLDEEGVLDGAGHIAVGTPLDDHRCFKTEQALGILDDGFEHRRQALPLMVSPLCMGFGVPAAGATPQLNASFLEALKRDVRV